LEDVKNDSEDDEPLYPNTAFTDLSFWWKHTLFSVRYEINLYKKVKVKFTLEHTTKAHRGS